MKKRAVVLGFLLGLLTFNNSRAESVRLDEVVVTATRTEVQRSQIPASVTVITLKEIEEYLNEAESC